MSLMALSSLCHPHFQDEGTGKAATCPSLHSWEVPEMELGPAASHSSQPRPTPFTRCWLCEDISPLTTQPSLMPQRRIMFTKDCFHSFTHSFTCSCIRSLTHAFIQQIRFESLLCTRHWLVVGTPR